MKIAKTALVIILFLSTPIISQAKDWYFDKDSIGGKCSDTGAGSITQPFCSIYNVLWNKTWNAAQADDTIYIRQGIYSGRLFWIKSGVLANGTPGHPITIRPYPGETVVFDGSISTPNDLLIKFYESGGLMSHDLSFVGPFEVKNYSGAKDDYQAPFGIRRNIVFDNWTVHNQWFGFVFRKTDGVTVRNCTFYDLKGAPGTNIADNIVGVSVRGTATTHSTNILLENNIAHDINDGRGKTDDGDADGFHTDEFCDVATFRNLQAYRCSEDGIDTKAQTVTMEDIVAYNNGATGIKFFGGHQLRTSTYNTKNLLVFGNVETGVKCTGNTDYLIATVDHLTAWGNGDENVKNTTGEDTSDGCNLTLRNSILGESRITAVAFYAPTATHTTSLILDHTNINHSGTSTAIYPGSCPELNGKYKLTQYTGGVFNTDMTSGVSCTNRGSMSGSAIAPTSFNPSLSDASPAFEWASISAAIITSNTVTLFTDPEYPWPSPTVGHYIEINTDGVKRQITSIGDAVTRTINFDPPVSSSVCGRITDCQGVRVIGWATSDTYTNNMELSSGSLAINAGVFVSGTHCAQADDNGGSGLTGCIHWSGTAPDLGYSYKHTTSLPTPTMRARIL